MGKARTHKENILRRLKKSGADATAPTPLAYIFTEISVSCLDLLYFLSCGLLLTLLLGSLRLEDR